MSESYTSNGKPTADLEDKFAQIGNWMEVLSGELERQRRDAEEAIEVAKTKRLVEIQVADLPKVKLKDPPHPKLERVLKLLTARDRKGFRLPVMLIGPAGAGKTYLAEQVAKILKLEFSATSCSAGMSEGQLLGRLLPTGKGGQFEYSETPFINAVENGGLHLLSEGDAADANTLLVLNTLIANGYCQVPNRIDNPVAYRHKDFAIMVDANTFGTGADRQYVGRNQLDEAFLDRFRIGQVTMDYAPEIEQFLCPDDDLRERIQHYRNNILKAPPGSRIRRIISTRFLEQAYAAKHSVDPGLTDEEIDEALFGGWSLEEQTKVKEGWISNSEKKRLEKEARNKEKALEKEEAEQENEVIWRKREQEAEEDPKTPQCPRHYCNMVRMASGIGWRCNVSQGGQRNRYIKGKGWTICNECIWDNERK